MIVWMFVALQQIAEALWLEWTGSGHFCLPWVSSDEDKAVLGWAVALLSFLDLLPRAAALMVDCCLPVEHSVSAARTTGICFFLTLQVDNLYQ